MTDQQGPTEEELREAAAAYEAELKRLRVEDVVLQTLVSLLNLGGRKAGLSPGTEDERDPEQLRMAVEGARALLPLIESQLGADGPRLREAISQLQMAYVKLSGDAPAEPTGGEEPQPEAPAAEDPVKSGRLWIPGQ